MGVRVTPSIPAEWSWRWHEMIAGCLVWPFVAIWILSVIHWMIMGELDATLGIISVMIASTLGFFTNNAPNKAISVICFASVVGFMAIFPICRRVISRHADRQLDMESMERAYAQLEQNSENINAAMRLATLLYSEGMGQSAVMIAERTLQKLPPDLVQDELRTVQQWKMSLAGRTMQQTIRCLQCGAISAPDRLNCSRCDARLLLDYVSGSWTKANAARKMMALWIVLSLLVIAIAITSSVKLGPALTLGLIIAELLAGMVTGLTILFRSKAPGRST